MLIDTMQNMLALSNAYRTCAETLCIMCCIYTLIYIYIYIYIHVGVLCRNQLHMLFYRTQCMCVITLQNMLHACEAVLHNTCNNAMSCCHRIPTHNKVDINVVVDPTTQSMSHRLAISSMHCALTQLASPSASPRCD